MEEKISGFALKRFGVFSGHISSYFQASYAMAYFIHSRPKLNVQRDSMRMVKSPRLLGT